jgi:hypothetical protein
MEPMSRRLQGLIEAEAARNQPTAEARKGNWAVIAAALGGPPGGPSDGGGPSPDGAPAAPVAGAQQATGLGAKLLLGGVLTAAAATAVVVVGSAEDDAPSPSVEASDERTRSVHSIEHPELLEDAQPIESTSTSESDDLVGADESEVGDASIEQPPPKTGGHSSTRREPPPQEAPPTLADELALIQRMHTALDAGRHEHVLELARRHEQLFSSGGLTPDRLSLTATALCRLGRVSDGRAALDRIAREWPRAPKSKRAMTACAPRTNDGTNDGTKDEEKTDADEP